MPHVRPSELELQVLSVLWERGPSSVRSVLEAMPDGKGRAYTTILSVMQVLEKKGLVGHTQQGQANVYHPLKRRGQVLRPMMKEWLDAIARVGPTPGSNFEYSVPLSEMVLLGVVAVRTGRKLEWDARKGRITNDPALNKYIKVSAREGWRV